MPSGDFHALMIELLPTICPMVNTATQRLTFEDYLTYDDGTDNRYELVDGELLLITPPRVEHFLIAKFI